MKFFRSAFLLTFFFAALIFAAVSFDDASGENLNIPIQSKTDDPYLKDWKKVDSLLNKGLTKSALEIVSQIYKKSVISGNAAQHVKSLIYRINLESRMEEFSELKAIGFLTKESQDAPFPARPVIKSLTAEMIWRYYQNNRWKINQRSSTENFSNDDIETWDAKKLADASYKYYLSSLENADSLKKIQIKIYDEILVKGNTRKFRPTLYDFLVHRAVDFFMNGEADVTRPADHFSLSDPRFLLPYDQFAAIRIESVDSFSNAWHAIRLLNEVTNYHLKDADPGALIDIDLKRLSYVRNSGNIPGEDSLYLQALKKIESDFSSHGSSAEISYHIAKLYSDQGNQYDPLKNEERFKWNKKKSSEICKSTISRFPSSYGAEQCMHLLASLSHHELNIQAEQAFLPGKETKALITSRNNSKIWFRIIKMARTEDEKAREDYYGQPLIKFYTSKKPLKEWSIDLKDDGDLNTHRSEFVLPELEKGYYILLASSTPEFSTVKQAVAYSSFSVTNLSLLRKTNNQSTGDFYVLHRQTGTPISNVTAQLWMSQYDYKSRKYHKIKGPKVISDEKGRFTLPQSRDYRSYNIELIKEDDRFYIVNSVYTYRGYESPKQMRTRTIFFTDRAIYRPGQTIHFKGIIFESDGEKNNIQSEYATTVTFFDANYQKVHSLDLVSNEYGSVSGTFTAPHGVLTGQMSISGENGRHFFSVEEYKRPRFTVEMEKAEGANRIGDTITVPGTARSFSGASVDGATVSYRVTRTPSFPFYWWSGRYLPPSDEVEIANGKLITNDTGGFKIKFAALPDPEIKAELHPVYSFRIVSDITEITGETRSATSYVTVGYQALKINVGLPSEINRKHNDSISFSASNLDGNIEKASFELKIYELKSPEKAIRERLWIAPDRLLISKEEFRQKFPDDEFSNENDPLTWERKSVVFRKTLNTETGTKFLLATEKWKEGNYVAEAIGKDKYGQEVREIKYFTLFDPTSSEMHAPEFLLIKNLNPESQPGEKVQILVGSSSPLKIIFQTEHKGKIDRSEIIEVNNSKRLIEIPVEEKHRGNFSYHFAAVFNNRTYQNSGTIYVPHSDKQLDIQFETFRNKLLPGQKEEWKVIIKGKKGEKKTAELLTAMYDASLDEFRPNWWNLSVWSSDYTRFYWDRNLGFGTVSTNLVAEKWNEYPRQIKPKIYDQLNWFHPYYNNYRFGYYDEMDGWEGENLKSLEMKPQSATGAAETVVDYVEPSMDADTKSGSTITREESSGKNSDKKRETKLISENSRDGKDSGQEPVQTRKNLNETAFFYPHLETNEKGEVVIAFTAPESLTKWKIMGIAHSRDLSTGSFIKEVVTQKELMVLPNAPRFFRENDEIEFTTKISNLSEKDLAGTARLSLFDALSMKPLDLEFENQDSEKNFSIKKGLSQNLSWKLKIPSGFGAITYRVTARAGTHSDGEENVVPVLTNRMLVTESLPLTVRSNETKNFSFKKLISQSDGSSTLRNHKLTLEFTANPAWYAIQALPYLIEYPYECSEQIFSRYYANSIASHISNSNPKIKAVFDTWRSSQPEALLSNLEKNQELKSALLEETPWVLDAKNETERKKRIALLFDLNKMGNESDRALSKMIRMQLPNGGWPWFENMEDDPYITKYIITGLGRLDALGIESVRNNAKIYEMVRKGVKYMDDRIKEEYDLIKKYYPNDMHKNHLHYSAIQYLYARSYFREIKVDNRNQKAFNYFKEQSEKYWLSQSRYMQGMIALSLHREGNKKVSADILKSLKENSISHEEMGMYWKDNYAGYYWYQAPVETQALLIEAFDEIANDKKSVDEMRIWLLKSKQTQNWPSTRSTAEACYALLLRGTQWLATEPAVEITLGDLKIEPVSDPEIKTEAGTGYFKKSWSGPEVKPEMGKIKVEKKDEGIAWGAVYWQYFEQLDKITPAETPLKLNKKLFVKKNTASGPVITPVTEETMLSPGDKIRVRIELRCDRDMEYVHMKDMRASGFEPVDVISTYCYQEGLGYYQSTRDAATNFFFSRIRKGTYVFEYELNVVHKGNFSNGITSVQCMYAPEFSSHSEGIRVKVK